MNATQQQQEEAREQLRALLPPGSTVYTVLKHVSRSGMSRNIDCFVIQDNAPRWISPLVSKATGIRFNEKAEALTVNGCGMDMGFHVVYELSYRLYPQGHDCVGENCPSNDHSNRVTPPAGTCDDHVKQQNGVCINFNCVPWHHSDGGYALRQRWM